MDDLPPPPPYSPNDPHAPNSQLSSQNTSRTSPIRTSLRGGYINIIDETVEPGASSAAAYVHGRPPQARVSAAAINIERTITPRSTRDELSSPFSATESLSHDITYQDWSTFVNHVVADLDRRTHENKAKPTGLMSLEEFQDCQERIEAVVADWNQCFFSPRKVRIIFRFSDPRTVRAPSPSPTYRTIQSAPPPFQGGAPAYPPFHAPPPFVPMQATPFNMPMHPPVPPFRPAPPHPPFMQVIPPHFTQPAPFQQPGFLPGQYPNPWHDHEAHRGRHGRRGDAGRRHHRSASTASSSSSSSSSSSASSLSSNDIEGVATTDIQQSLANFRLNPTRKVHVHAAVRQLHEELRSHRRSDTGSQMGKRELKAELKAQKRMIKAEVKQVVKEAKGQRREEKRQRKAERKVARAEARLRKVERRGRGDGFGRGRSGFGCDGRVFGRGDGFQ